MRSKEVSFARVGRHKLLSAPFVATVVMGAIACESPPAQEPEHWNRGPPQGPSASASTPTATASASVAPVTATASATPSAMPTAAPVASSDSNLPNAPTDGSGHVVKQADGTCLYEYPDPPMPPCPPHAFCNPGPPREPLNIRCPPTNGSEKKH